MSAQLDIVLVSTIAHSIPVILVASNKHVYVKIDRL